MPQVSFVPRLKAPLLLIWSVFLSQNAQAVLSSHDVEQTNPSLSDFLHGGQAIPVASVRSAINTAQVSNAVEWCTPAVQVGPRTFITAAHCAVLLAGQETLRVQGPNLKVEPKFKVISTPGISDESSFSAPNCKAIFSSLRDGDTLTREQMLECWANNGQADLALIVVDQDVPGAMLSVALAPIVVDEALSHLGYSPSCGGDAGYYRTTAFKVFGFNHMQVALDGRGMGISGGNSWSCGGDSGGIYYRPSTKTGVEIAAVLTASTHPKHENMPLLINGKNVILPPHLSGGTNLTDPDVRDWLEQNANANQLKICGINAQCSEVLIPEGGSIE